MRIIVILTMISLLWLIPAYSQYPSPTKGIEVENPQPQAENHDQKPQNYKSGTDELPFVIKLIDTPESKQSAEQTAKYQNIESSNSHTLIVVTAIIAFVAILQWIVMIYQTHQLKRSVDVLASSERAVLHVVACNSDLRELKTYHSAKYRIQNYGRTYAIVKEISHCLTWAKELPIIPIYNPSNLILEEPMISAGIPTKEITCKASDSFMKSVEENVATFVKGDSAAWFYGRVVYHDIFGYRHEHRFIQEYNIATNKLTPYYGTAYKQYNTNT
ncbi:hypothetical protein [Desulfamplus magnetovallimortis]|nr:hypothetical protein [Desulfamplus magnetovallimortis]